MRDTYTIHITPVPKPRMTQRDKWAKRPAVLRYRAFCDELRAKMADFAYPPCGWHTTFYLPIPKSRRKELKDGDPHRQKPDLDNLVKAVLDALHDDDSHIWDGRFSKRWSATPRIELTLIQEQPHD